MLALDRGIAIMINRPLQRDALFKRPARQALPAVAADPGCVSWGQCYLKFIIGHQAVTCQFPATSKVNLMQDNMGANKGPVPDADRRKEMVRIFDEMPV